jgi:glycosyltransferase involved in cell wall biosynthesis
VPIESRDRRLLDAFAAYAQRQLGDPGAPVVVVDEHTDGVVPDAVIALVAGRRRRRWERRLTRRSGLRPAFRGVAQADPGFGGLPVTIWDRWPVDRVAAAPPTFDVTVVITTYNEEDIIGSLLDRLVAGGMRVIVVDNWSTDATWDLVAQRSVGAPISMERFPPDGPSGHFDLEVLLARVDEVAQASGADWVIHHDADEIRESPWPGVGLRQALFAVQSWGFNAVDHIVLNFRPVDDSWLPGGDLATALPWFEFGDHSGYFYMIKAWKPQPGLVSLAASGGHDVSFPGRRVFPYKFRLRHYPIRSQAHGERKVLRERVARWNPEERARGWHNHYDHYTEGSRFLWDRADLRHVDELDERFLLQRLSGAALPGNPRLSETLG